MDEIRQRPRRRRGLFGGVKFGGMISEGSPIAGRCVHWESAYDLYSWPPGSVLFENHPTSTHVLRPRKGRAAAPIDTARRAGTTEQPRKTNARRAILRRQTLGRQHDCSLSSFWSATASEQVLSRIALVVTNDDSLTERDTPLLLTSPLLLSGRTTRLYGKHEHFSNFLFYLNNFNNIFILLSISLFFLIYIFT